MLTTLVLALALAGAAAGADITLADGRILREAMVLDIEGGLAVVRHAEAIEGVPVELLPRSSRVVFRPEVEAGRSEKLSTTGRVEWLVGRVLNRRKDGWITVQVKGAFSEVLARRSETGRRDGLVLSQEQARRIRREREEWKKWQPRVAGGDVLLWANVGGTEVALRVRSAGEENGVRRYRAAD